MRVGKAIRNGLSQGHGNGHGKGHDKHGDDDDQGEHYYKDRDGVVICEWFDHYQNNLPLGLAKRDQLPPGLKSSLRVAARSHQGFRNDSNRVPKTLSGGYLRRLLIARTCQLGDTLFC